MIRSLLEGVSYSQKDCLDIIEIWACSWNPCEFPEAARAARSGVRCWPMFSPSGSNARDTGRSAYGAAFWRWLEPEFTIRYQRFAETDSRSGLHFSSAGRRWCLRQGTYCVSVAVSCIEAVLSGRMSTPGGADPLVRSRRPRRLAETVRKDRRAGPGGPARTGGSAPR